MPPTDDTDETYILNDDGHTESVTSITHSDIEETEELHHTIAARHVISLPFSILILVSTSIGTAIILVPNLVAEMELPTWLILMPTTIAVLAYCGYIHTASCQQVMATIKQSGQIRDLLPEMAQQAGGVYSRYLVITAGVATNFFLSECTAIASAHILGILFPISDLVTQNQVRIWFLLACLVITPITYLGYLKDNFYTTFGACLLNFMALVGIIIASCFAGTNMHLDRVPHHPPATWQTTLDAISELIACTASTSLFMPNVIVEIKEPKDTGRAIIISYLGAAFYMAVASLVPFLLLRGHVTDNILDDLLKQDQKLLVHVVGITLALHGICAAVIIMNPAFQQIEEVLHIPENFTWKRVAARTSCMLIILISGLAVPSLEVLLGMTGGILLNFLVVTVPTFVYLRLIKEIQLCHKIGLNVVMILSSLFTIFTVYFKALEIIRLYRS